MSVESLLLGVLKTRLDKRAVSLVGCIWSTFLSRGGLQQISSKLLVCPTFLCPWNAVAALLLHSHTQILIKNPHTIKQQKNAKRHLRRWFLALQWSEVSQYLFANSDYSTSSCVLTEAQELKKEDAEGVKAELGNSSNYSATHPLTLCIVSPGRVVVLLFSCLCFCRVQGEMHDQELIWSWKEQTKRCLWTLWPAFPCSCLAPHSLWIEAQSPNGAQGCVKAATEESKRGFMQIAPLHWESSFPTHWCPNTEICWDKSGRFSKHWGVV